MNKSKTFDYFNKVANTWLEDLEEKNEEDIIINPFEGSWSISELYDHIIKVARTYQIPNFKKSVTTEVERKKRKNIKGLVIFNVGIKKINMKIKMENFPKPLVKDFTPIKQNKTELIKDFKQFINEVNSLEETLLKSKRKNKHYHLMFGDINTKDWFTLIAFHMAHHEKQKKRINEFLESS